PAAPLVGEVNLVVLRLRAERFRPLAELLEVGHAGVRGPGNVPAGVSIDGALGLVDLVAAIVGDGAEGDLGAELTGTDVGRGDAARAEDRDLFDEGAVLHQIADAHPAAVAARGDRVPFDALVERGQHAAGTVALGAAREGGL